MEQPLIGNSDAAESQVSYNRNNHTVTFRQCLRLVGGRQRYQSKLFALMAAFWIFASFFISIQFFMFKKPIYCQSLSPRSLKCCHEGDYTCNNVICHKYPETILNHIKPERTLTYDFDLFCQNDDFRVMLKVLPQTLSFIGFIIYGRLADLKGRKTASNISWRMFTFGVCIYAMTEAMYLKIFGYIIASMHCLPALVIQFVLFFQQNIEKSRNRTCLLLLACLFVGPLVLSLSSSIISKLDNRVSLGVLCALPAFVLSILVNRLNQSAVYIYPYDKLAAFNIINRIGKQNNRQPIFIDLSRSHWHKWVNFKSQSLPSLFFRKNINRKLILGFIFMFAIVFNMKMAQVSLDSYTNTYSRSILINIPTALADMTLCIFLVRFQHRTCKNLFLGIIWLLSILLTCHQIGLCPEVMGIIVVTHSMIIRYLSQLSYGILIIWSIETFPTISRASCTTFVFCGTGFGCALVYLLRFSMELLYVISVVNTLIMMWLEKYMDLHKYGTMVDTFSREYYDENDKYYKF